MTVVVLTQGEVRCYDTRPAPQLSHLARTIITHVLIQIESPYHIINPHSRHPKHIHTSQHEKTRTKQLSRSWYVKPLAFYLFTSHAAFARGNHWCTADGRQNSCSVAGHEEKEVAKRAREGSRECYTHGNVDSRVGLFVGFHCLYSWVPQQHHHKQATFATHPHCCTWSIRA